MTADRFSIVGPPGCGKTTTIKRQLEKAAHEYGAGSLAVASLTRAAIAEITGRTIPVPQSQAKTMHGLALGALGGGLNIAVGREPLTDWNNYAIDHERPDLKVKVPSSKKDKADDTDDDDDESEWWQQRIQKFRATMLPYPLWGEEVRGDYNLWCEWKDERGFVDWTDLIEMAGERTAYAPGAPTVLFIDEAQDLDRLMMRLVERWAEEMRYVVMVGDPDQCLYEWRGSDPNLIHEGYSYIDTLKQSYRVPRAVHEVAVRWIEESPGRIPVEYYPTEEEGEVIDDPGIRSRDARSVVDAAIEYMDEGTVMILAQSRYPLIPIIAEMRRRGLPFHNPYRTRNGHWNPMGHRNGTSTIDRLLAFCAPNSRVLGEVGHPWRGADVALWTPMLRAEGIIKRGQKSRLAAISDDADWPAIIRTLEEAIEPEAFLSLLRADPDWLIANTVDQYATPLEYPAEVLESYGARGLREAPRIIIGTVHSVKGGEADTVILMPDMTMQAFEEFEGSPEGNAAMRRVFYVGMTRARHRLILGGAAQRQRAVTWE